MKITALILLIPMLAFSQAPTHLSFEVATIKPADPISPAAIASGKLHVGMSVDGNRVDIGFLSLAELIPIAFKVKPHQVSGPDSMKVQRFDIKALLPDGTTKEQVPEMMQALLEERFGLKTHREMREMPVYALTVAKTGSKLKEAEPDQQTTPGNQIQFDRERNGATIISQQTGATKISRGADGQIRLEMGKMTMPAFAEMLTRLVDRPVVDMTELKGTYQVGLDLSLDVLMNVARAAGMSAALAGGAQLPGQIGQASDPSGSSIFASVQQLGLKLDSQKSAIDVVVVDHVEKMPTEN